MKPGHLFLVLLALLVFTAAGAMYFYRAQRRLAGDVVDLANMRRGLETQVASLEQENQQLRYRLEQEGIEMPARPPALPAPRQDETARLEAVRALIDLQNRYDALQKQITGLQNHIAELEGTVERLTADNKKLTASEQDLKDSLAAVRRVADAADAELRSKADRIASLEVSLEHMRDDVAASDRRFSVLASAVRSLEDVNRRRENTVTTLQRRYRELTDTYRSLAFRLDSQRDNPTAVPLSTTDVSRISTVVQSAEDDLRQLSSLNAQAQRLTANLR